MKKKIAVYASGWSMTMLEQALEGMKAFAKQQDFDIFLFLSHASYSDYEDINEGELNICKLAYMEDFDGAIVFSSLLNSEQTAREVCLNAKDKGIPVVSVGMEIEGIPYIGVDNALGMQELVSHLVQVHGAKRIAYIGGTKDHPDSIARLQAVEETLESLGRRIRPEDIFYADWSYEKSVAAVVQMIESKEGLPDAIICANDYMALGIMTYLTENGYHLPEDVAVTGVDWGKNGRFFYPALTTVAQDFEKIGYDCCEYIYRVLETQKSGEEVTLHKKVPTKMILAESCGCVPSPEYETKRQGFCASSYMDSIRKNLLDQRIRVLQSSIISENPNYEAFRVNMPRYFERNHIYEGDNFYLVMDNRYFGDVMAEISDLIARGHGPKLDAIVALKDGKHMEYSQVDHHELIPGYQKKEGVTTTYIFMPLHINRFNYGYVVFQDEPMVMKVDLLNPYVEKLKQALENLRVNLRLDTVNKELGRLYDKDQMTDLFNRFGYENKAIPLFERCKTEHSRMMVMFVDINYMKRINDRYGHIHGDQAIMLVAESIKQNLKENWIAVRFGGDEFLIIAPVCGDECAQKAKKGILGYLEEKNGDGTRPYQISASCGYVLTDPASEMGLQDYIREADAVMYEIKRKVHANDEK